MSTNSQVIGTLKHMYGWTMSNFQQETVTHTKPHTNTQVAPVIYYIHGTADRIGGFAPAAKKLLGALPNAFSKIHLVSFNNRWQGRDIPWFAMQLAQKIILENDQDILLIGHSRGGLVASWFAENLAKKLNIKIHSVTAICSPFGGSPIASAPFTWYSSSVNQMQRGSRFLRSLCKKVHQSQIQYHYFAAEYDFLVTEDAVCIQEHKNKLIRIKGHNHLSIVHSNELIEYLRLILTTYQNISPSNLNTRHRNDDQLIFELKNTLSQFNPTSAIYEAGKNFLNEAIRIKNKINLNKTDILKWRQSVRLATHTLTKPKDKTFATLLDQNARLYSIGMSNHWKKFAGVLITLAGVLILALGVTLTLPYSTPLFAGLCVMGSMTTACGATLFYSGRQKSIAKAAQNLAKTLNTIKKTSHSSKLPTTAPDLSPCAKGNLPCLDTAYIFPVRP